MEQVLTQQMLATSVSNLNSNISVLDLLKDTSMGYSSYAPLVSSVIANLKSTAEMIQTAHDGVEALLDTSTDSSSHYSSSDSSSTSGDSDDSCPRSSRTVKSSTSPVNRALDRVVESFEELECVFRTAANKYSSTDEMGTDLNIAYAVRNVIVSLPRAKGDLLDLIRCMDAYEKREEK